MVPAVWGSLLAVALLQALNPMRLGIDLLIISRPRPVQNLLVYWVGALLVGFVFVLVPLTVLHVTPMFTSLVQDLSTPATNTSSTVRQIQIGLGVLALSVAVLMTLHFLARKRAHQPTPVGSKPNTGLGSTTSDTRSVISRLLSRTEDAPTKRGSAVRRLLDRVHNAWENGSLWVAFMIGLLTSPGIDGTLYVLSIIVPSGGAFGMQVVAASVFVVGSLAVIEIALISYLAAPSKAQAVVQLLHDWAQAHSRKILIAMFAVVGVSLVANGMANI